MGCQEQVSERRGEDSPGAEARDMLIGSGSSRCEISD